MSAVWAGAVAGAAGTTVLDAVTYLDMAVRGRPASEIPQQAAGRLASLARLGFGADPDRAAARRSGVGALLGYATGVGVGVAWALAAPRLPVLPLPVEGAVVGLAAMAASDTPLVALGLTDPRTWGAAGWLSDLVPHLAYGVATVAVLRALEA